MTAAEAVANAAVELEEAAKAAPTGGTEQAAAHALIADGWTRLATAIVQNTISP
jgi:hypothetical protein